ncbi:MAG TPA: VOC family protein [Polyangiaceae bacterium]|nr:VOC family protein [Polyangiaceae bacterium]
MLGQEKLVAFVATAQPQRAKRFYGDVLGLKLLADDPYAIVFDAAGTLLRVQKVDAVQPPGHTALGWQVTDIAQAVAALREKDVAFERYEFLEQDPQGVWTSPAGGKIAWFKDPDGNVLSLTQFPERA